jgi:hypothetical protein
MPTHATGTFEVKLTPQPPSDPAATAVGRLTLDKQFHGDLEATSLGEMLSFRTTVENSAGYVALEQATGALHGRSGTFALQHNGLMTRGEGQLTITIVPDSGTGELTGIVGQMTINIVDGQHFYDLEYTLTENKI